MKITYTIFQGSRIVGLNLVAYSAKEIKEMVDVLNDIDKQIKAHALVVKIENGEK